LFRWFNILSPVWLNTVRHTDPHRWEKGLVIMRKCLVMMYTCVGGY